MKGLKQKIDKIKPQFEKGGRFEKLHSVFDGFYTFLFTPNETSKSFFIACSTSSSMSSGRDIGLLSELAICTPHAAFE